MLAANLIEAATLTVVAEFLFLNNENPEHEDRVGHSPQDLVEV
jgi:hypothetical protein